LANFSKKAVDGFLWVISENSGLEPEVDDPVNPPVDFQGASIDVANQGINEFYDRQYNVDSFISRFSSSIVRSVFFRPDLNGIINVNDNTELNNTIKQYKNNLAVKLAKFL